MANTHQKLLPHPQIQVDWIRASEFEAHRAGGPKIRIDGVSKSYDGKLALTRVDLQLMENSFTCLLGPSGCGKSTLQHDRRLHSTD